MINVLILHTSMGHGIMTTAEAVAEKLRSAGGFEVRVLDVQKSENKAFVSFLKWLYLVFTESAPWIWGYLYNSNFICKLALTVRMMFAPGNTGSVRDAIREFKPDIIVSAQAGSSGIVSYLKKKGNFRGRLAIVFSDYHFHPFWMYDNCDLYVCATAEQAAALRSRGVANEKIALAGMNIKSKYFEKIDKKSARRAFGLDEAKKTVLLAGGARGLLSSYEVVQSLLNSDSKFQIAVISGINRALQERLREIKPNSNHPIKILGYIDNFDILLSAADVLITKPGGPTIAEAVAKGLAVILTDAHPGHEEANRDYLVKNNIALYMDDPKNAAKIMENILKNQDIDGKSGSAKSKILNPPGSVDLAGEIHKLLN